MGFLCFGLAVIGFVVPLIPCTPFLLVSAFSFARSSERLDRWFKTTRLYRMVLENYVAKKTMTLKAKLTLLVPVTMLLAFAFAMMGSAPVGRAIVAVVWVGHIVYFGFIVKTEKSAS
ncbi:hypothetical protein JI75_07985 [Berryella intestinalis]|uniref:DUF454 domain-containing protein n=1 Tax=Berryella intestinalis TaxID=1531429 RepID=A0A0A8B555_9ACTN|nr:hypothetical protein JI75_07985 [Berryella intestinalis]